MHAYTVQTLCSDGVQMDLDLLSNMCVTEMDRITEPFSNLLYTEFTQCKASWDVQRKMCKGKQK